MIRLTLLLFEPAQAGFHDLIGDQGADGHDELEQTGLEGCLSVPGKWGIVTRPSHVRVRAQDRNGDWFEVEGDGLTARCFCHETEHLDGHLFVEKVEDGRLYTLEELEAMEDSDA